MALLSACFMAAAEAETEATLPPKQPKLLMEQLEIVAQVAVDFSLQ